MVYIKEKLLKNNLVKVKVDGFLDYESIPVLDKVCQRHLRENRRVQLFLRDLHVSWEGREFLKRLGDKFILVDPP